VSLAQRILGALSRRAAWVLASGVFLGLLAPDLATVLRPLLPATVAGLLCVSMLRIHWRDLLVSASRPARIGALLVWLLVLCPVGTWLVVTGLPVSPDLVTPLVLMAATPPLFSTPAMAFLWGFHAPLALVIVVLATLVGPFSLVLVSAGLLGLDLGVDPVLLMVRLSALVAGAFVVAWVCQRTVGFERLDRAGPLFDVLMLVLLLLFAVAVMDGVPARFHADPGQVLRFIGAAFVANLLLQVAGGLCALRMGWHQALTVAYATGNRAIGLLLAGLPPDPESDLVLYCAVGQMPVYLLPLLIAPAYRRLALRGRTPGRSC
jgi:BASS family bile acid:Na+ symporter